MSSKRVRPTHEDVLLISEVADSSLEQDLGEKAKLYAEHRIPEYWVVDVRSEQVHVHRKPERALPIHSTLWQKHLYQPHLPTRCDAFASRVIRS